MKALSTLALVTASLLVTQLAWAEPGGIVMDRYSLGPGDVITIQVWKNEDLTRTVTVRPDGNISFPLIGELHVSGMAPGEVQASFTKAMSEFVDLAPREVAVIVDEVNSYWVSVVGEVREPGRYNFHSRARVLDALAMAGGPTEYASRSHIVVLRTEGDQMRRHAFDYNAVRSGDRNDAMNIQPGDIVLVP